MEIGGAFVVIEPDIDTEIESDNTCGAAWYVVDAEAVISTYEGGIDKEDIDMLLEEERTSM